MKLLYELFLTVLNCLPLFFATTNLLIKPLNNKQKGIIFLFLALVSHLIYPIIGQAVTPFILICIALYIFHVNRSPLLDTLCIITGYLATVFTNFVVLAILNLFDIKSTAVETKYFVPFCIIFSGLMYIITYAIGQFMHNRFYPLFIKFDSKIMALIAIEMVTSAIVFLAAVIYGYYSGYTNTFYRFNCFLFAFYITTTTLILLIVTRTIKRENDLVLRIHEQEQLQKYTNKIEAHYNELRSFKHDYINILLSISTLINENKYDELKKYYTEFVLSTGASMDFHDGVFLDLQQIEDPGLKGLLYSKILLAKEKELCIKLELLEPITALTIDTVDCIRMLGIYLDNAIEAAEHSSLKELQIAMMYVNNSLHIVIRNSCDAANIDMNSIYRDGFSTKGDQRGMGLSIANNIINKYTNIIHTTDCADSYFTQSLQIL